NETLGSVGLVVGATVGDALVGLGIDLAAVNGPILAPGLGAQGATGADMRATFGAAYPAVLGTSSRGILAAGPDICALRLATTETLKGL
ncbi:MAG: orotidine 5'-phosphate decarboxylase, partial [Specibacter sp.]